MPPPNFVLFLLWYISTSYHLKNEKTKILRSLCLAKHPTLRCCPTQNTLQISSPTPNGFSLLAFPLLLLLLKSYLKFLHTRPNISTTPPLSLPFPIFWAQQNESIAKKGTHPPFHFKHYTFLSLWVLFSGEEYARSTPNMVGVEGGPKGGSGLDPMGEGPKPSPNKIK